MNLLSNIHQVVKMFDINAKINVIKKDFVIQWELQSINAYLPLIKYLNKIL